MRLNEVKLLSQWQTSKVSKVGTSVLGVPHELGKDKVPIVNRNCTGPFWLLSFSYPSHDKIGGRASSANSNRSPLIARPAWPRLRLCKVEIR